MSEYALEIEQLTKRYHGGTQALKGVSFKVKKGEFFALLGRNGAGKSTTIGIISSLVRKTSGQVKIFGEDIEKDFAHARRKIGIVAQEFNLPIFEKVIDILIQQAGYYGIPAKKAKPHIADLLKQLDLWTKRRVPVRSLSGGMKRRLMIAIAMVHQPELLILDEPTAGVDIELRRGLYEYLERLSAAGVTIILTTHYLEEAERLCNQIVIIDHGEVILDIPKRELIKRVDGQLFVLDLENDTEVELPSALHRLDDGRYELALGRDENLNPIFAELSNLDVRVKSIAPKANRLEQVFLGLTGKEVK